MGRAWIRGWSKRPPEPGSPVPGCGAAVNGLECWSKIAVMSSRCHDYVVCSNSWQFRLWTRSLLTAHGALRTLSHVHSCTTSVITARSSICSGSMYSLQPHKYVAAVPHVQSALRTESSRLHPDEHARLARRVETGWNLPGACEYLTRCMRSHATAEAQLSERSHAMRARCMRSHATAEA